MRTPSYAPLDDALAALAPYGPELRNGNSNHAPMVAEALCAMGRPEAAMPWIARYRDRMSPRSASADRIRRDEWRPALGRRERFADWSAFFREELKEAPWRDVLDRWTGRLAPGFCAAATHGPIRVGHAVRSLAQDETPNRLAELADALASWAAAWQELPGDDGAATARMSPRHAIAQVPLVQRRAGNIVQALAALGDFPEFAPAIGLIDTGGEVAPLLAELTETFAHVYLANARDIPTVIAFIHGLTSHAALANLAPQVSDAVARRTLRYAWQAGCGLYACFGRGVALSEGIEPPDQDADGLADRAIAHGDEHVIKFTEACLGRHAIGPSPVYYAAADHAQRVVRRR